MCDQQPDDVNNLVNELTANRHRFTDVTKQGSVSETIWLSECSAPSCKYYLTQHQNSGMNPRNIIKWPVVGAAGDWHLASECWHQGRIEDTRRILDLQICVRETASNLTKVINAFQTTLSQTDQCVRSNVGRHYLFADCEIVSDSMLPSLVQAAKGSIMKPHSLAAHKVLISAAINSLKPGVQLVIQLRQMLNCIDDGSLISDLTSLALATAASLLRMRHAADDALRTYCDGNIRMTSSYDVLPASQAGDVNSVSGNCNSQQVNIDEVTSRDHQGQVYRANRRTLGTIECCDAAYRQIQCCGMYLEQNSYWPTLDSNHFLQQLTKVVHNCYALGKYIADICHAAKQCDTCKLSESVRCFASAVSRILIMIPQINSGRTNLLTVGRAIRHCASSLLTSARWLASDQHHSAPYRAFASHSHALSQAVTELIYLMNTIYLEMDDDLEAGITRT
jgi:hypothetical protein